MSNLKILFVASEFDPFLNLSQISKIIRILSRDIRAKGAEVRIVMPKFGVINDRKNRLHEVVRLSGINIKVGNKNKPLIIKVASIREERLQIYFLDNQDYFKKKLIFNNKNGEFLSDNHEKLIFFSKGLLETIIHLEWSPNIIHCNDWISSLVPMYLKTLYKNKEAFKNTRSIYTLYNKEFTNTFDKKILDFEPLLGQQVNILNSKGMFDYESLIKVGSKYSDLVTKYTLDNNMAHHPYIDKLKIQDSANFKDDLIPFYSKIYNNILSETPECV